MLFTLQKNKRYISRLQSVYLGVLPYLMGAALFGGGSALAQQMPQGTILASLETSAIQSAKKTDDSPRKDYQKITLGTGALFAHNKTGFDQISEQGKRQIYDLAIKLRGMQNLSSITITGHSDLTNGTNIAGYNDKLSLGRASAVRDYLADLGFDVSRFRVVGMGERQPLKTDCQAPKGVVKTPVGLAIGNASKEAMDEFRLCLQPNRRVEVEIFGYVPSSADDAKMANAAGKTSYPLVLR